MSEPADTPAAPAAASAPRRPGLVRWWGFLLVLALVLIALVVAPWWADRYVRGRIDQALLAQGWELDPASRLSVSVFGGRLASDGLRLRDLRSHQEVLRVERLDLDLAVIDSAASGDLILDSLVADGVAGTLRRGPDGRIPWQRSGGTGDTAIDWAGYWRSAVERAKRWMEEREAQQRQGEEGGSATSPGTVPAPAPAATPAQDAAWPAARRFPPSPRGDRRVPRLLVRSLAVSGTAIALPDPSALDVHGFSLTGSTVADRLQPGERMELHGTLATAGAGGATVAMTRSGDGTGTLNATAEALPVAVLAEPNLGGESVARYGANGTAAVQADFAWSGWDLTRGDLLGTATGLHLAPTAAAGPQGQRAAQVVNALKGRPVVWPMRVAGPLWAPRLADSGIDQVAKGALAEAAKEQAREQLGKQLDKQAEKDPRVKQGLDSINQMLGR